MYNRYIPQPDGSYRRRQMEDSPRKPGPPPPGSPPPQPQSVPKPQPPAPPPQRVQHRPLPPKPPKKPESLGSFLRHLLPRELDTEDLIILLLLLLMSGDCKEDQNTALLTLALYLFL